jgi:hypothetical protein
VESIDKITSTSSPSSLRDGLSSTGSSWRHSTGDPVALAAIITVIALGWI